MIDSLQPMLAFEQQEPFDRQGWGFEVKYDGYRLMAQAGSLGLQLRSRRGADAATWFPELIAPLAKLRGKGWVFDGEACVLDDRGRSSFDRLHDRARRRSWDAEHPVTFCVFDCLVAAGRTILEKPLTERKKHLDRLRGVPGVLVVDHMEEQGTLVYQHAVMALKLEGMMAKRLASTYQSGERSRDWIKVKRAGAVRPERFKRDNDTV